jgi:hypothetical protein
MKFSLTALAFTFWCVLTAAAPAPEPGDEPDWSKVLIEGITYAGSGCKAGSVAISKTNDWKTVTLAFDDYIASIGPGEQFVNRRKNCNINVKLHYPQGYSYTLYQTDYIGHAELEDTVTGKQQSTYWFAGYPDKKAILKSYFNGPLSKNYEFTDLLANEACVWSPCGASTTLNIDTELLLEAKDKKKSGFLTTDVIDHKVKQIYGFKWKKC